VKGTERPCEIASRHFCHRHSFGSEFHRASWETMRDLPGYEIPGRVCEGMKDIEELMSNEKK